MKSLTMGNPMKTLTLAFASAAVGVLLGMLLLAPFPIAADDDDPRPQIVTQEEPRIFHLVDSNGVPGQFTLYSNSGHLVLMLAPEAPAPIFSSTRDDDDD